MAPQGPIVVTLRLPREQLEAFDFADCRPPSQARRPRKRPAKARARAAPSSTAREAPEDDGDEPNPPAPRKMQSAEPRGASAGSGIISGGGGDPILGNLPRSVKAAPVANTAGLDLDKTPCRRWTRRPIQWKSFTGFAYNVTAWCSDYTPQELEEKTRRDAELEEAAERDAKAGRGTKRSATPKAAKAKRKPKSEPGHALPTREASEQQDDSLEQDADADADAASEPASDLPSEPPSEAAPPSELNSELA